MDYKDTIKRVLLIVLGIVVLAIVAAWFISKRQVPEKQQVLIDLGTSIEKTNVAADQNPEKFPTNIPIEAGAKIVQNYNATAGGGRFQATRVFETGKTLNENLKIYQDFMKADGWAIQSTVNQANYKMLFASKGDSYLQVSMNDNQVNKTKTVNISYSEVNTTNK
jgi:hypothetical protein